MLTEVVTVKAQRDYSKEMHCLFCKRMIRNKMKRHLKLCHSDESRVAEAMGLEDIEKKKAQLLFDKLRHEGNFEYNLDMLATGAGQLLVARKPAKGKSVVPADYLPCRYCLAFYARKELCRHVRKCPHDQEKGSARYHDHQIEGELLLSSQTFPVTPSNELKEHVLVRMRWDPVSFIARRDSIILLLAKHQFAKQGPTKSAGIRQKMRLMAKLLVSLRNRMDKPNLSLYEAIHPNNFDQIKDACLEMAGNLRVPSLALKLGYGLVKCAVIAHGQSIRERDEMKKSEIKDFQRLYKMEWNDFVQSPALQALARRKLNKEELLPLTKGGYIIIINLLV